MNLEWYRPVEPLQTLARWVEEAGDDAFVLATATADGVPSARVVLLKEIDAGELIFGTTLASRKGRELLANPRAACVFYHPGRQARVHGPARVADRAASERLWRSRGRDGRLVDVVSREGEPLEDPLALRAEFAAADARYGDDVPCPEDWAVIRVRAEAVELWTAGERRLAERTLWVRDGEHWRVSRLQP
jgi:pyridoxine/pyridoxamine 5'-phosphate oxidase